MNIKKTLTQIGLSDKEIKIYLALLSMEIGIANDIAKKASLNRSTTYVVLDSLIKKGYVTIASAPGIKKYVASSPEILSRYTRQQLEKHTILYQNIKLLLPNLRQIYKGSKYNPKITLLHGKDGLIEAFNDSLYSKENLIRVSSNVGKIFSILPDYFIDYVKKRFDRNLKIRGIHLNDEFARKIVENDKNHFDDPILIPSEKFKFPSDLTIYDNKTCLISTKDLFSIIIESKEITDIMKTMFDLAWEGAKQLKEIK